MKKGTEITSLLNKLRGYQRNLAGHAENKGI
jgi:hypothetical protein